jgi:hypothetical protein
MADQNDVFINLYLDGEPYDDAVSRILELEVDERTDGATSLKVSLDMAPQDGDWDLLADGRFSLLRRVDVELGVGPTGAGAAAQKAIVFSGYLTAVEPHFGEQQVPDSSLHLFGLDASCLMHFEEHTRAWSATTDADIVKTLYQSYGFTVDVSPTPTTRSPERGPFVQRTTDAEMVYLLAKRNGFEAYVERTSDPVQKGGAAGREIVGHFHLPRVDAASQPKLMLTPRESPSLTDLKVRWDSHRPTAILGGHIDERTRRLRSSRIDQPRYKKLGTTSRADILKQRLPVILPSLPTTESTARQIVDVPYEQQELDNLAWSDFRESDWLAEAHGVVQGLRYPAILRARRPVDVAGAGRLLDGTWYVRRACHRWVRDAAQKRYEIDVSLLRNALNGVA